MAETPMADLGWAQLADVDPAERERKMEARFIELAKLPEEERRTRLHAMALAANTLPVDKRVDFARSYLLEWLRVDLSKVKPVVASYNAVMDQMSGDAAWRRVSTAQAAVRGLTPDQQTKLHDLFPREVPAVSLLQPKAAQPEEKSGRKWGFGKK